MAPASSALAQERAVLVVRARDEALGAELAGAVARGLEAAGIEVRRPARREPPVPDDTLDRARAAYHALDPESALRDLEGWIARAEESGDGGPRERWIDALVWLALARLALGDGSGADAALDRALGVDGSLALDPARYPPTLRERLEERRARPRATATLRVEAEPHGARVQIDGEMHGVAPLAVELTVGPHLVRVAARGHRPDGRVVEVRPEGASVTLRAAADPESALLELGPPGSPLPRAARAAAESSGERVIVVDLFGRPGELRARMRDEGSLRRATAGPAASASALADGLLTAWSAAASPPEARTRADDALPWIGLGVGAAIVVGVAIGLAAGFSSQPSGFTAVGTRE